MNIYLAARYSRRFELRAYANALEDLGHRVTARWLRNEQTPGLVDVDIADYDDEAVRGWARTAWQDIAESGCLIAFTEPEPTPRGGRHVELGLALAWGLRVLVVGPRENVFCYLPAVEWFPTWAAARRSLAAEAAV